MGGMCDDDNNKANAAYIITCCTEQVWISL